MSDVLLIDNSILQETVLVPVTTVQPDLVTQTDVVVYVPLASKNAHGIVKIGNGLNITNDGELWWDASEVPIKYIAKNGEDIVPDDNKRVNIVLNKIDVGLSNVDNTSDLDKPISNATQQAINIVKNDVDNLSNSIDDLSNSIDALVQTGVYSINGKTGNVVLKNSDLENDTNYATEQYVQENGGKIDKIVLNDNEQEIINKIVTLTIDKTTVGLSNVDNTSDRNKPISDATQKALDNKASLTEPNIFGSVLNTIPNISTSSIGLTLNDGGNRQVLSFYGDSEDIEFGNAFSDMIIYGKNEHPKYNYHNIALDTDLDTKIDKSGGIFTGNVGVQGNLSVSGTITTKDTETLKVQDNVIVTNANKIDLLDLSGLAINKNDTQTYGIMYDVADDSVKLGLGSIDSAGKFTFNEGEGSPVATRSDSGLLTDNHLIKWDATNNKLVDSGYSTDSFVTSDYANNNYVSKKTVNASGWNGEIKNSGSILLRSDKGNAHSSEGNNGSSIHVNPNKSDIVSTYFKEQEADDGEIYDVITVGSVTCNNTSTSSAVDIYASKYDDFSGDMNTYASAIEMTEANLSIASYLNLNKENPVKNAKIDLNNSGIQINTKQGLLLTYNDSEVVNMNKLNATSIRYDIEQTLTDEQKAQARANIDAASLTKANVFSSNVLNTIPGIVTTGILHKNEVTGTHSSIILTDDTKPEILLGNALTHLNLTGKDEHLKYNNLSLVNEQELSEQNEILNNHKFDKNNPHEVTKNQIGLSNVDNTSDLNKPISTQTQTALDGLNQTITNNFNNLNSSIENETERATLAETEINTKLQQEMNTRVQEHAEIQGKIDTINSKIPNQASSTNQLADKDFVNSTINSSAAFFKGSFESKAALDAVQWQTTDSSLTTYVTNNDYAYIEADETHNNEAWRYIYVKDNTVSEWQPQFRVNESPFTQAQLDAINSGATTDLINSINSKLTQDAIVDETGDSSTKAISQRTATLGINTVQSNLNTHILDKNNPHQVTKAQVGLGNVDNTSDLDKPISTAVQNALKDYLPLTGGNLTSNISVNNKAKMTTEGYVVGTWLQATNTTDIGNSNWSDVWVNHNGWLYKRNKSDFINDLGSNNYVPITRTINSKALSSDITLNNKDVGALPDYTLTISHQTAGNPRMVKFVSVNYASKATCFKMGAMTCHDNGSSYQFLTDMLIAVTTGGEVTANIYKFAQTSIGNVDGIARYTGDVFYVNDTTNKIVDFYILCGQWSASQFTPVTKVGSTTIAYVTQYSGDANYYSSGDKVWVNGCGTTYARLSDIPTNYVTTATYSTEAEALAASQADPNKLCFY